jgi:DNA repair protein RadC
MTLYEPVGKVPDPSALAGFIPCKSEDELVRHLLRPLFDDDRETLLIAGFDAYERLVRLERADGDSARRCAIPPRCWRALLGTGITAVIMAHNHPSGAAWPSDGDRRSTQDAVLFLRTIDVELIDHLIFVDQGHFSFRQGQLL